MTDDDREYYEERAAIREFDAGLPRHEAERLARQDLEHRYRDTLHHRERTPS